MPGNLHKSTTENMSFFNREQVFVVKKITKMFNKNYNYWVQKEGENKVINKHFLRQDLFAFNNQCE